MMECTFQVGDRVVCVDASTTRLMPNGLVEGKIYIIREVLGNDPQPRVAGNSYYGIADAPHVHVEGLREEPGRRAFAARRFRPVKPLSFWIGEKQKVRA